MTSTTSNGVQDRFVELMGQLAEMCSFSRSIGQIYGVLYLSPEPLSLDDVATACRMSKGNASIHVRTLETWGAVHQSSKPGNRKDYYVANRDLRALMVKRLHEGLGRRIDHARTKFREIQKDPSFLEYVKQA